jgi:hypothetical protein
MEGSNTEPNMYNQLGTNPGGPKTIWNTDYHRHSQALKIQVIYKSHYCRTIRYLTVVGNDTRIKVLVKATLIQFMVFWIWCRICMFLNLLGSGSVIFCTDPAPNLDTSNNKQKED